MSMIRRQSEDFAAAIFSCRCPRGGGCWYCCHFHCRSRPYVGCVCVRQVRHVQSHDDSIDALLFAATRYPGTYRDEALQVAGGWGLRGQQRRSSIAMG